MTASSVQGRSALRILGALHVATVLLLAVVPFLLVFAISFGHKVEGAAWVWGFELNRPGFTGE